MTFRIFDHVLANHTWGPTGQLCIARAEPAGSQLPCDPLSEKDALLRRLALRSKQDRVLCRAAKRLMASPIPLDELARELGVGERYLRSGLGAALGVDPAALFRPAPSRLVGEDNRHAEQLWLATPGAMIGPRALSAATGSHSVPKTRC